MMRRALRYRCLALLPVLALAGCAEGGPRQPGTADSSTAATDPEIAESLANPVYQLYVQRAAASFQSSDLEDALEAAKAAVTLAPRASEPYGIVSRIMIQAGRDREAISFLQEAARDQPRLASIWFLIGTHRGRLQRWQESVAAFEKALELGADDVELHFRLATALHTNGEFERAVEHFRLAYAEAPNRPDIAAGLGRALRIVGDYAEAERVVSEALGRSPESAELHYAMAQFKLRQGDLEEGEQRLRRAIELNRSLGEAYNDLAGLLSRQGREQESRRPRAISDRLVDYDTYKGFLIKRTRLLPDHPRVPLLLAELELSQQKIGAALRGFRRSETLGGPAERIAAGKAHAYFLAGDRARGEAELARIGGRDDPWAELARAASRAHGGGTGDVVPVIDRALAGAPEEKTFLWLVADLYERAGRDERFLELLLRADRAPFPSAPTTPVGISEDGAIGRPAGP